ncbi:hypothetical protein ABMA28_005408 [Loxostege sticticalis]|uniref:Mitochondrial 2-oxoglutarate/malate carrier protein n=1 Tax=Loxostege sticticalis TaxID=481309 RepID=A0ABD0SQX1_LOXSC
MPGKEIHFADKDPIVKVMPTWVNFVLGGMSGMMAISIVQPADLVKTRMQLRGPGEKRMTFLGMTRDIVNKEGVRGLYTGLTAALFRQATYGTGRLGCFNGLMDIYKGSYGTPSFAMKLVMAMVSGGFGAFIGTPAEVALIRMTADGRLPPERRRNYTNVFNALSRIAREEGVTTLWRGAVATCTRALVVNGAQLGSYAQAREMLLSTFGNGITLHFVSSMIAGFVTSVASLPVDMIKTQVQYAPKGTSQMSVLMSIVKNEGVLALWKGLLPTYLKIGPMTVLTFIFLEQLNALYYKYF